MNVVLPLQAELSKCITMSAYCITMQNAPGPIKNPRFMTGDT